MSIEFSRRVSDQGQLSDPMMLLGQLHARVGSLEDTTNKVAGTIEKVASDVTDMKMLHAAERGRDKAYAFLVRAFHIAVVILTGIGTAYATVKNLEMPHVGK